MVESNTSSSVADLHGKLSGAHFLLTKIFIKFKANLGLVPRTRGLGTTYTRGVPTFSFKS